jgi:4-azaleucine resistance transporter AzlC
MATREQLAEQSSEWGSAFRAGMLAVVPLWLASIPFAIIFAVTAMAAGLNTAQVMAMSLFVFAGSAQFIAAGLFARGASAFEIVITTLIVNARHLLMSASLGEHIRRLPSWLKTIIAFQLTDETYAIGIARYLEGRGSTAYLIGANLFLYIGWQVSTLIGILVGQQIPDPNVLGLDLVFPLTFLGLLVPLLRERANAIVAAIAAVIAVGGALLLPGSWYILLAGLIASGLGIFLKEPVKE